MKTIIKITNDYHSSLSYDLFTEDINYLVNELNIYCEIENNKFNNIVEDQKRYISYKNDYKNKISLTARGYSQNEWQTYTLYYNKKELNNLTKCYLDDLIKQLQRSFTHFNDYNVEKFEREIINGKVFNSEPYDYTSFCIDHIEFPNELDVISCYNDIYGIDYDEHEIEID